MWAPGMLAVCVDDRRSPWRMHEPPALARGCIYTVTAVRGTPDGSGSIGIRVAESVAKTRITGENWFHSRRFRPVSPVHKQIIRDLLVPVPDPDLIVEEGIDAVLRERLGVL